MIKISCDIDGVLANFDGGYLRRFGKWPKCDWVITRNVTYILSKEKEFWLNLDVLNTLNFIPSCYCSARVNKVEWTQEYLDNHDFPKAPLYQIPGYKLSKANCLNGRCDVHIEDSMKNFLDLNKKGIPCLYYNPDINCNPILHITSLDYYEIEEVYSLGKENNIFNNFKYYETLFSL